MGEGSGTAAFDGRPHDLVWVGDAADVVPVDGRPAWATAAWLVVAPAVVRRARPAGELVAVGLRGTTRSERCAAQVRVDRIVRRVTPREIARDVSARGPLRDSPRPCLRALAGLAGSLDASGLGWGITGGVGFTLASGLDVLRDDSDLDLLVMAPDPADAAALRALGERVRCAESRVDVQVETPHGAFALNEWLRTGGPVLLRTDRGPVLRDDPWCAGGPHEPAIA